MKILYVASIGGFFPFLKSLVRQLLDAGHKVDFAANYDVSPFPDYYKEWGCGGFNITVARSPLSKGNIKAIKQIREIVRNGSYDAVHCHTPVASICTRIACRPFRKKGLKVFYTAHGFHFFKGAPLKNWLLFYPIEKLCSRWTDVLITINREDYTRAQKKLKAKKTVYVPGVGIDTTKFGKNIKSSNIRHELSIGEDDFMLLSVGELNDNKNHETAIRALKGLNIVYVIVGAGYLEERLKKVAEETGVRAVITGYRTDVFDFYHAADAFILPSMREGLNVSLMEAMASGLPCLAGKIRGNTDLIDGCGGFLFDPHSADDIAKAIRKMIQSDRASMSSYNIEKIKNFDIKKVNELMINIYGV